MFASLTARLASVYGKSRNFFAVHNLVYLYLEMGVTAVSVKRAKNSRELLNRDKVYSGIRYANVEMWN